MIDNSDEKNYNWIRWSFGLAQLITDADVTWLLLPYGWIKISAMAVSMSTDYSIVDNK